ncbi:MAG: tetratricopeptide repeat protein, partial [Victivallales bacterium]|nr:tetratricopeptide repeat protein [Victivallales bacterium]
MATDNEAVMRQALMFHQRGDRVRAGELYRRIIRRDPRHAGACHFYGLLLHQQGDNAAALVHMERALRSGAPSAAFYANTGSVYEAEWRLTEAAACYRRALHLAPAMPEALLGAGVVAQKQGDYPAAEQYYRRAVAAAPPAAAVQAHWNLALLLLLTGRYDEGWREYEWRLQGKSNLRGWAPTVEEIRGPGRSAVLINEMGFGDIIQFIRFLPQLRRCWPEIDCKYVCPPPLTRLFLDSFDAELMVAEENLASSGATAIPMMSVPHLLRLQPEMISGAAYLRAGLRATRSWGRKIAVDAGAGRLKVGLVWAGSPTHVNDRVRSLDPELLRDVLAVPEATFFSLQRGMKPEAAIPVPKAETVVDYGCRIDNFADLAAIMVNLDVVVSVDTAALHLAGALGVKAYGLIHFSPDLRWELAGEQTRWYDTVTLLRQE